MFLTSLNKQIKTCSKNIAPKIIWWNFKIKLLQGAAFEVKLKNFSFVATEKKIISKKKVGKRHKFHFPIQANCLKELSFIY